MPSDLVDSAITVSFSKEDSVVMDGRAARPASWAFGSPPLRLSCALADGVAADGIILDISVADGFTVDVSAAGGSAAIGSVGNSVACTRQRGRWQ